MSACIEKLGCAWEHYRALKDWRKCAKILRDTINFVKTIDGGLAQHEDNLANKIQILEDALPSMQIDESLTVISHLRHARTNLRLTSAKFGSAFQRKLEPKERARIRRRNRSPAIGLAHGVRNQKNSAIRRNPADFRSGNSGGDEQ